MITVTDIINAVDSEEEQPKRPTIIDLTHPNPSDEAYEGAGKSVGLADAELEQIIFYMAENSEQFLPLIKDVLLLAKMAIDDDRLNFNQFNYTRKYYKEKYEKEKKEYDLNQSIKSDVLDTSKKFLFSMIENLKNKKDTDNFTDEEFAFVRKFLKICNNNPKSYKISPNKFHRMLKTIKWDVLLEHIEKWTISDYIGCFRSVMFMMTSNSVRGALFDCNGKILKGLKS